MIKYKFFCTFQSTQTEVFPLGFNKDSFIWEREGEEIFFRKKLDGQLEFTNRKADVIFDFDYFYDIEQSEDRCEEISFLIQRSCDNGLTYSDYWNGYLAINGGEFDLDRCIFKTKINVDDKYRCYVENSEKEFNINAVPNVIFTNATFTTEYEFFTCRDTEANCNASRPAPASTWLVFHTEVLEGVTTTIYYREVAVTACQAGQPFEPTGDGWEQDLSYGLCTNGFAKWVRVPVDVVVNNPNPEVLAGNCDDGVAAPPPRRKTLTVTKSNTTPTPEIIGRTNVVDSPSCKTGVTWKVRANTGSTYSWSITGTGNTITSGALTSEVTADLTNAGNIKVIETTACGASTEASLAFTISGGSGAADFSAATVVIQRRKVCPASVSLITTNYDVGRFLSILSDGGTGSTLDDLGSGVYELTAGAVEGTVTFIWAGGGACDSNSFAAPLSIQVTKRPTTPDIIGMTTVCKSGTTKYNVASSDSVTYAWTVTGGSIISGQGTNEINVTWNGTAGSGTVELRETTCNCNWIKIADCGASDEPPYYWCPDVVLTTFRRTRLVKDVLDYIATQICASFNLIKSDFFAINPPGDAPGYATGINYVTQELNKLIYLSITAKEAILNSAVSDPADNGILTWASLTKILRKTFQVYWFVDANDNVRFEHISYFQRTVAFNLTTGIYAKFISGTRKYTYEKVKMPKYERFKWMEAINTDFIGAEIRYDSICVSNNEKENVKTTDLNVTTDIQFINNSPDDISEDGFVLLVNDPGLSSTDYTISVEEGLITGLLKINAHLSWANLHYNYFRHDRVLLSGFMNLEATNFLTAQRFKKQVPVRMPFCCDDELEPLEDLITTGLGNGIIDRAELDIKTNMLTLDLLQA